MRDYNGFARIDDYGVIGDRRSAALVAPDGSIDWLCWPHFHSPSLFAAILDPEKGGHFRVGPAGGGDGQLLYDGDTNLLLTQFVTEEGALSVGDTMTRPGDRPEADPEGREHREVLRRIECTNGRVEIEIDCSPRFEYGRFLPEVKKVGNSVLFYAVSEGRALRLRLLSPRGKLEARDDRANAGFYLEQGEVAWISLSLEPVGGPRSEALIPEEAEFAWYDARSYWDNWVARGNFPTEHRDIMVRSALITHLLRYAETGASVAAPTTSLPEIVEGTRNYDYRYAWVRDGSLGLAMFSLLGYLDEAKQSMLWLSGLTSESEGPLQVAYTVKGEPRLEQKELGHLHGYRNAKPVRIGNHAWRQMQPDELGILVDCILIYYNQGGEMLPEFWDLIDRAATFVHDNWRESNNGIWENIERKEFVSSLILCWVALDRGSILARKKKGWEGKARKWQEQANKVKEYTLDYGYDEKIGAFTYTTDDKRLDASVLTAVTYRMFSPNDIVSRSTMRRIREQLSRGDMLLRHLLAEEADHKIKGLPALGWLPVEKRDNPFHPCTLWLSQAYALAGDLETANSILRWTWEHASPLGLLSEEYAPDVGEARGNYPLIFSHMELLKAVYFILSEKRKKESRRAA